MRDGKAHVFFGLGGNFVQAAPDTDVTADALRRARLTVHVSTKINRSHLVCGETALILPTLGRTEKDVQASGEQFVSVEDSTCSVHASRGPLQPASPHLRSEVAIVTGIAERTLGDRYGIDWAAMRDDYRRDPPAHRPGGAGLRGVRGQRVDRPGGFVLPHPPRDSRTFPTASGRAEFAVSPIEVLQVRPGQLVLQTLRSHDQFNTTIYGLDDRYRGIQGGRRVVFVHPDDLAALGLRDGELVDLVGHWAEDDVERRADGFRIVAYDTPRGCAAAYYPETNALVPLDSTAEGSNTPTSKSVIISLVRARVRRRRAAGGGAMDATGADEGHKSRPEAQPAVLTRRRTPIASAARERRRRCRRRPSPAPRRLRPDPRRSGRADRRADRETAATYRPDPGANTIAWLIWHLSRVEDESIADLAGTEAVWPRWRDAVLRCPSTTTRPATG